MTYYIPTYKVKKLDNLINKAQKSGSSFTYEKGNITYKDGVEAVVSNGKVIQRLPIKIECVEVFIDGTYKNSDWEFVGTIQHLSDGNVINLISSKFQGKVPLEYFSSEPVCEHCHKIRSRQETFLIYNTSKNLFTQVGRTCLKEYTDGLNPIECTAIMGVLSRVADLSKCEYECECGCAGLPRVYSMEKIRKYAYAVVKKFGYDKKNSSYKLEKMLEGGLILNDGKEVNEITEYAKGIDTDNSYLLSAKNMWLSEYCKSDNFNLILSFVAYYLKQKAKSAQTKNSEYIGNVGEKVEFDVASSRLLYMSTYNLSYTISSYTFMYEVIDTRGNVYLLKTSNQIGDRQVVKHIKATVTGHAEYRGVKQTKINRAKIS